MKSGTGASSAPDGAEAYALGELADRVGNELNNPLAAVLSAHEYLRARLQGGSEAAADPRIAHFFSLVERELGTMARIVEDLRVYGGPQRFARSSILLRSLVDEVFRGVRCPASITLVNEVPETIAPVHLDHEACLRIVTQLVRNAIESYDAGAKGSVTVTGWVEKEVEKENVVVVVRDEGAGIPAEVLPRIFEPLYGAKAKGTGLGLAIADRLARAHGGTLSCTSEPGRGSTFTVRVPAR